MQFLLESLTDLDASLRARGSRLFILQGNPVDVLPQAFKQWNISKLCFEYDTEPYANVRDTQIKRLAQLHNISVHSPISHTLYDLAEITRRAGNKAPLTMKAFEKIVDGMGAPPPPTADPPPTLPPYNPQAWKCGDGDSLVPRRLTDVHADYALHPATTLFHGGEQAALGRLAAALADPQWVCDFEKPKGNPATFTPRPATTVLSPYLKFGCLSVRLFHSKLVEVYNKEGKFTKPPVSLRGQLLWREFFYTVAYSTPNFDKMVGNPICRQITWRQTGSTDRDSTDSTAGLLSAWEEGRTGYPWIDAIMIQLRQEGWMHHLARHSVACFLTRGDLWCSWEAGRDVFDRLLIDADWALNSGNWMWLSASAFFHQYFRVYSPISFGKQYDKNGEYIRRYVPVLKDMPAKYIYEPWTAPRAVQAKAGCIIGVDYPAPIVDHAVVMKENMEKMKQAFASGSGSGTGGGSGGEGYGQPKKKKKPS